MKRVLGRFFSLFIILSMLFCFTPVQNAYAENMVTVKEPVSTETYMAGTAVPIVLSPQMYGYGYRNYAQVEILKGGKRVFFENVQYYGLENVSPTGSFIPSEGGTYTIKAGMVFTNDAPPDEIYRLQQTSTFKVIGASSIKKMTPEITCERNEEGLTVLTCTNSLGGASKMKVYRAEKKSGKYKLIDTVSTNVFIDTDAIALKTYYYKVKWSLKVNGKTYKSKFSAVKGSSPARPQVACARTAKGKVKLTCVNKPSGVKMQIYRATSKNGKYKLIKTVKKASFTDTSAKAKKVYFYKVRFTQKSGKKTYKSKYSAIIKAEKAGTAGAADSTALSVAVVNTSKGVKISWKKYSGAGYYLVSRSTSSSAEGEVFDCLGEDDLFTYDADAEKGKTYYYVVSAWYGNDEKPLVTSKPVKIVVN